MVKLVQQTRKGVASLYVVIFATILFGLITLSFVRLILSEHNQSLNDELSQSAYDSAMAGVEDAKRAVSEYYRCLEDASCPAEKKDGSKLFGGDCENFNLNSYLYGTGATGEVQIQASSDGSGSVDQAYTCVIVKNVVPDYRSTLTSDNRTRVVPLGLTRNAGEGQNVALQRVDRITFGWYSETNGTVFNNLNTHGGDRLPAASGATTPPTISLTLIRTGRSYDKGTFSQPSNAVTSTMVLLPTEGGTANTITNDQLNKAADAYKKESNLPLTVGCNHGKEFACEVNLTGLSFEVGDNAMLVISMPYGDTVTDFAVTLWDGDESVEFQNTQISVDSTGRANQLVRRVETRLDPADLFFPYPQYGIELTSTDDDSLRKSYWITNNCWTESGTCANNGEL